MLLNANANMAMVYVYNMFMAHFLGAQWYREAGWIDN